MSTPKETFAEIANRLNDKEQAAAAKEIDAVYQFHVTGDEGGDWVVDLRNLKVSEGKHEEADCTITVADADFVAMAKGEIPGQMLFMTGRLAIAGNMGLALKLGSVLGQ